MLNIKRIVQSKMKSKRMRKKCVRNVMLNSLEYNTPIWIGPKQVYVNLTTKKHQTILTLSERFFRPRRIFYTRILNVSLMKNRKD